MQRNWKDLVRIAIKTMVTKTLHQSFLKQMYLKTGGVLSHHFKPLPMTGINNFAPFFLKKDQILLRARRLSKSILKSILVSIINLLEEEEVVYDVLIIYLFKCN